jgi:hypothetical protein
MKYYLGKAELFMNNQISTKKKSNPEPTAPGVVVSVLSDIISAPSSNPCSLGFNSIGSLLEQLE